MKKFCISAVFQIFFINLNAIKQELPLLRKRQSIDNSEKCRLARTIIALNDDTRSLLYCQIEMSQNRWFSFIISKCHIRQFYYFHANNHVLP